MLVMVSQGTVDYPQLYRWQRRKPRSRALNSPLSSRLQLTQSSSVAELPMSLTPMRAARG